jgi:hypothetical protein
MSDDGGTALDELFTDSRCVGHGKREPGEASDGDLRVFVLAVGQLDDELGSTDVVHDPLGGRR